MTLVQKFILNKGISSIYEHKILLYAIQITSCCFKYEYCSRFGQQVQPDLLLVCFVVSNLNREFHFGAVLFGTIM